MLHGIFLLDALIAAHLDLRQLPVGARKGPWRRAGAIRCRTEREAQRAAEDDGAPEATQEGRALGEEEHVEHVRKGELGEREEGADAGASGAVAGRHCQLRGCGEGQRRVSASCRTGTPAAAR